MLFTQIKRPTMKILNTVSVTFLLNAIFCFTSFSYPVDTPTEKLRGVVFEMLKKHRFDTSVDGKVRITFFMTPDEKMVVLKTDARNKKVDQFIKSRLNYKHHKVKGLEKNQIVHIKVHFRYK